ncbi:2OG-Fe(II) oxygenase [Suillus lakei]|nr:2OG-Fe(II) oxygenase [Suillus lakei]
MSLAESASVIDGAFQDIPVIDLSHATSPDESERKALAYQIRDACMNVGFFYVKNHGIPPECIDNILKVNKEYFNLPTEEKLKLNHKTVANFKGYTPLLDANIEPGNRGDLHEGSYDEKRANDGAMAGANVWPERPEEYREGMLKYYHAAVAVGKILFPLFALSLDLPERYFDDKTKNSAAIMNTLHYPPQTGPADDRIVGIGAHTECCFTILWQQPGIQALQILNSQKQWIKAPPIDGTLVINLGDQFTRWTNDIFKSTVHRAVNRNGVDRYSIPLFFGTDYDVNVEPIASCVSTERPARYDPVLAGEYVNQRLKEMYY